MESLETASDYEQGFERLKAMDRSIVEKLEVAAGNLPSIVGKNEKVRSKTQMCNEDYKLIKHSLIT